MLLCIYRGPRKGANFCTEETMRTFTAKFTIRKADQDTNNWYVFLVVHFVGILVRFPVVNLAVNLHIVSSVQKFAPS